MARHTRLEVLTAMKQIGLIPVFYNADFDVAKNVVNACADGGARAVEFTNRGDRAINVFTKLAEYRDKERPDIILGVGSVCDAPTAAMYIAAGADFVVGPLLDEDTARLCNSRKVPYSPGCGSVTEIHKAEMLGVEICKVFPGAQVGGPAFVKAVKAPCPWTDIGLKAYYKGISSSRRLGRHNKKSQGNHRTDKSNQRSTIIWRLCS